MPRSVEAPSARARSLPTWAALAVVAGLIGIVALASRSTTVPLSGVFDVRLGFRAVEVVGYLALFLGLTLLPWVIFLRARRRSQVRAAQRSRQRVQPPARAWVQMIGIAFIGSFALAQGYMLLVILNDLLRVVGSGSDDPAVEDGIGIDEGLVSFADGDPTALAVAGLIALAIGAAVIVLYLRWRRADDEFRDGGASALRDPRWVAADISLEALAREPDPRKAIIAAYAALERSLSRAGLGRIESEAPVEYLERVLAGSTGSHPEIRTVSRLFQIAKFSAHPVGEPMRAEAIAALERFRNTAAAPLSSHVAPGVRP